jgi:hypothetical protein
MMFHLLKPEKLSLIRLTSNASKPTLPQVELWVIPEAFSMKYMREQN